MPEKSYAQMMLAHPGILPKEYTGALPTGLAHGLVGALLGRYLGTPLLKWLNPRLNEDRLRTALTLGGAGLGILPGMALYGAAKRGKSPNPLFGGGLASTLDRRDLTPYGTEAPDWMETPTGDARDAEMPPEFPVLGKNSSAIWQKAAAGPYKTGVSDEWLRPAVPVGVGRYEINEAVRAGTLTPTEAMQMTTALSAANENKDRGFVSLSRLANTAAGYGIGYVGARAMQSIVPGIGSPVFPHVVGALNGAIAMSKSN